MKSKKETRAGTLPANRLNEPGDAQRRNRWKTADNCRRNDARRRPGTMSYRRYLRGARNIFRIRLSDGETSGGHRPRRIRAYYAVAVIRYLCIIMYPYPVDALQQQLRIRYVPTDNHVRFSRRVINNNVSLAVYPPWVYDNLLRRPSRRFIETPAAAVGAVRRKFSGRLETTTQYIRFVTIRGVRR